MKSLPMLVQMERPPRGLITLFDSAYEADEDGGVRSLE